MVARGIENYEKATQQAEASGRGAETTYGRKLITECIQPVADRIREIITTKKAGRRNPVQVFAAECDPEKAAFLTLQVLFNSFTFEAVLASTAVQIGRRIEDEVRFSRFQQQHGAYYAAIQQDFKRKGTQQYGHKHRVLVHSANKMQDGWADWTPEQRAAVGSRLIDIVLEHTSLLEKREHREHGKTIVRILPTQHALQLVQEHREFAKLLFPDKMPCVIPPDPWTGIDQGGYYSPELRQSTAMVKTSSKRHRKVADSADLSKVMEALNVVQAVAWGVNGEVLRVMQHVWQFNLGIGMPPKEPLKPRPSPVEGKDKESLTEEEQEQLTDWKHEAAEIYKQERDRQSTALLAARIIRMAEEFQQHSRFWYVWYLDFRGRLYAATSGFSPQGPDYAKGLLHFADGKPLGERGWFWLRVHGANRFGYDKVSYEDRATWVDANRDRFLAAAANPLAHAEVWGKADKPWQFLAFLFEYRDAVALHEQDRVHEFVSRLPVGLDGSCNGLQNFSAALRDHVGGKATNLVPADKPADIYSDVAALCTAKLQALLADPEQTDTARIWLSYCDKHGNGSLPRSIAKRPVMTLPYGATRQSCTKYIFESILKTDREHFPAGNFRAACWLTPILWEAIGETVVAARDAMAWLQQCSSVMSKANSPIIWDASDGFRVFQGSRQIEVRKIETQLGGRFQMKVGTHTEEIDSRKQRSGIAPNFVHSLDAAHLRETVRRASVEGIEALAVIHDDYGTHAADTDKLHRIIREAFVSLYSEHDPLRPRFIIRRRRAGEGFLRPGEAPNAADAGCIGEYWQRSEGQKEPPDRPVRIMKRGLKAFRLAQAEKGAVLPPMPEAGALEITDVLSSPFFFG